MNTRRVLTSICAVVLGLAVAPLLSAQAQIVTSQQRYSEGEGMVVFGTGFTPQVTITLTVQRPDKLIDVVAGVVSDINGAFTANYAPPMEPGRYNFTATDNANTAKTATTGADNVGFNKASYRKVSFDPLDTNGTWVTGNSGSFYQEQQWAFYQYEITGAGTTLPDFDVTFNHFDSSKNAIFVDAFTNFRACVDCVDNADANGLLLDGSPHPASKVPGPSDTTILSTTGGWLDATGVVGNPGGLPSAITDINGTPDGAGNCSNAKDPINAPSANHCFHVDGTKLKALVNAAYNYQHGNACPGVSCVDLFATGTHSVTIYYEAHLAASFVWSKGNEYLLGCAGNLNYVAPGPWVIPFGAPIVYGTEAYKGPPGSVVGGASNDPCVLNNSGSSSGDWTLVVNGIGFASGSSRQFDITNQGVGSNGKLALPIPSVSAPTGSITIVKVTSPAVATGLTFPFTATGTGLAPFTLATDATTGFKNTQSFTTLAGGATYTVTEGAEPTGWNLTNLVCTGDGTFTYSPSTTLGPTANIVLSTTTNAAVTCTYTNTGTATLILVKNTLGGNGTFSFTETGTGLPGSDSVVTTAGTGSKTYSNITPGSGPWSFTETVPAGWTGNTTNVACVVTTAGGGGTLIGSNGTTGTVAAAGTVTSPSITNLAAGATVTCTFTNSATSTIVLVKNTVGGNGTFAFTATGSGLPTSSFNVTTVGGTKSTSYSSIPAGSGTWAFTETVPTGWTGNTTAVACVVTTAGAGGTNTIGTNGTTGVVAAAGTVTSPSITSISPGATLTCTFTNSADASIVLVKNTVGGDGTFAFTAAGSGLPTSSFNVTTVSGTKSTTYSNIAPGSGTWAFTETVPTGWTGNTTAVSCAVTTAGAGGTNTIGANGTTGVVAAAGTVTSPSITSISPGATLTCTFTNSANASLVLVKNTLGGDGTFAFTAAGSGLPTSSFNVTTVSGTKSTTYSNIAPGSGTWAFTETVPTGWTGNTTNVSCAVTTAGAGGTNTIGTNGTTGVVAAAGTVTSPSITSISPGATVTCTFTNSATSTIVLVKNTVGGNGTFAFTATGSGLPTSSFNVTTVGGTKSTSYSSIPAGSGTWAFTETVPTGWTGNTTAVACVVTTAGAGGTNTIGTNGTTGVVAAAGTVTSPSITSISPGATLTCTFTNSADASIVLVKNTVGGDGTFAFTAAGSGLPTSSFNVTTVSGTKSTTYSNIAPGSGTWAFTETVPTGWTGNTTAVSCAVTTAGAGGTNTIGANGTTGVVAAAGTVTSPSITSISPGATLTCTFTNSANASLVLVKNTLGGDGTFAFTAAGSGLPTSSFNVTTVSGTKSTTYSNIAPGSGTWAFTETVPTGWTGNTTNVSCAVTTAGAGGTNTIGTNGTTGVVAAAGTVTSPSITSISPGATVTCTFTNSATSTIVLVKNTVGGNGTFAFTATGSGLPTSSFNVTTVGGTKSTSYSSIPAGSGTWAFTETVPTGWTGNTTAVACVVTTAGAGGTNTIGTNGTTGVVAAAGTVTSSSITSISPGATLTCTFTNSADASIVLVKNTVGGNGTFNFTATGSGLPTASFPVVTVGGTKSTSYSSIPPGSGTWSFTETVPTGWTGNTTAVACVVTTAGAGGTNTIGANGTTGVVAAAGTVTSPSITSISPGATLTCTFTNSADATIVLVKNTLGGNGTFAFTAAGSGLPTSSFNVTTVSGTKSTTYSNIAPGSGTWAFTETVPTGWIGNTTNVGCAVTSAGAGGTNTIGTNGTTGGVAAAGTVTSPSITSISPGATLTCTFYNGAIPTLKIVKNITGTVSGSVTFSYSVSGANTINAPTTYISFTSAPNTNSYGPVPINLGNDTISEDAVPSGWTLTDVGCSGYSGGGTGPSSTLDSNGIPINWNFTATYGDSVVCTYTNSNAKTTRTQGFWATHTLLSNAVWGGNGTTFPANGGTPVINPADPSPAGSPDSYLCGVQITAIPTTEENWLMGGFWANIAQQASKGGKRTSIDQARMQMLQQYLAAVLNSHMFGSAPPSAFSVYRSDYCGTNESAIQADIGILGNFNQSGDNLAFDPGQSATTQTSKAQADLDAWDAPGTPGSKDEDAAPKLALVKVLVMGTDTLATTADFTLKAACAAGPCGSSSVSHTGGFGSTTVTEGTYTLTDTNTGANSGGYTPGSWSCTAGTGTLGGFSIGPTVAGTATLALDQGAVVSCSITNTHP